MVLFLTNSKNDYDLSKRISPYFEHNVKIANDISVAIEMAIEDDYDQFVIDIGISSEDGILFEQTMRHLNKYEDTKIAWLIG